MTTMTKVGNREEWLIGDIRMTNVHAEGSCVGEHCVLHRPSEHTMREWDMAAAYVPSDIGLLVMMYRVCEHGIWHNDPDSRSEERRVGKECRTGSAPTQQQ